MARLNSTFGAIADYKNSIAYSMLCSANKKPIILLGTSCEDFDVFDITLNFKRGELRFSKFGETIIIQAKYN